VPADDADGPWPPPRDEWLLPLTERYRARAFRRFNAAVEAMVPTLSVDVGVEAVGALARGVPAEGVTDEHGNAWLVMRTRHGETWGEIATAAVGLWFVPERGGWCYCPDPLLDDDVVAELELPPGPWGDAGPLVPVEP
jgi:hypothetical protein